MTTNDHDDAGPPTGIWLGAAIRAAEPAAELPPALPTPPTSSWLSRLVLTEPVRLYLYSLCLALIVAGQLTGWLTGQWVDYSISTAGVVLGIGAAGEAVRASVYSPASTVRAIRAAVREVGR